MTGSIGWTQSPSRIKKYMTESTLNEAITPMMNWTNLTSLTHLFQKDYPTPKSAEEAGSQCLLKGLSQAQGAVSLLRKAQSRLNTKKGSIVDRL